MNSAHLNILAVDDDSDDLAILRHHLAGMSGIEVEFSGHTDPESGLLELTERPYDVVFLDFDMGVRTGLDVFEQLQLSGLDVPVIMLTDKGDEELAVRAMHAGVADYMSKGATSARSLRRAVVNAVDKFRLRDALSRSHEDLARTVNDLRLRNEEIQSFYHTLSHELKTPLTAAREFISIILDGVRGEISDEQRECLMRALRCCDQMKRHLDDILDASRLDTGKLAVRTEPVALGALLTDAVAQCAPAAQERKVSLKVGASPELPCVLADASRMLQVVTNLVGNAIKYSKAGSTVLVTAETGSDSDYVAVSVRDWGRGIPANRLDHVFDRLYQASEDDATVRGGLGMGLYLCREIVRLHGGEISAQSRLGHGSTFRFTVPTDKLARQGDKS